ASLDRYQNEAVSMFQTHGSLLDNDMLVMTAPVVGPWLMIARGNFQTKEDMWLLVTCGALQAIGITTLAYRAITARQAIEPETHDGLELTIAPVVFNHLGLSLTLSGF